MTDEEWKKHIWNSIVIYMKVLQQVSNICTRGRKKFFFNQKTIIYRDNQLI